MIRSADEIYTALETALKNVTEPQTCADLMGRPLVREAAITRFGKDMQVTTNKLSDLLGFMWRKGVLDRFAAPPSRSMARYAYLLKDRAATAVTAETGAPIPKGLGKHALAITEKDGEVILDFKQFTIVIKPK